MILGIIGCGNMGGALLNRLSLSGIIAKENIYIWDVDTDKLTEFHDRLGVTIAKSNTDLASKCTHIVLATLPQLYDEVMRDISPCIQKDACIITIAPGYSLEKTQSFFSETKNIVRTMPNTPCVVGEGMVAICPAPTMCNGMVAEIEQLFSCLGKTEIITEKQFNAFIGICGSSPAYVFMFVSALADGGVLGGLTKEQALPMAAQAIYGSMKLVLESGKHPEMLKDGVTSPGGATIEGVATLEKEGFRNAVIQAVRAVMDKADNIK